jgi:hypothetical protein
MSNFRIATATQNALANQVTTLLDASSTGTIKFYTSPQPANANTAISTQTLLATLTFASTAFGAASSGVITANGITGANAVATGTTTWARAADGAGNTVFDCDVSTTGATINLNTTAFVSGGAVALSSFTITMPPGA